MKRRTCRNHRPAFKAKVSLPSLKGEKTLSELARQFGVRANQITQWRGRPYFRTPTMTSSRLRPIGRVGFQHHG